MIHLAASFSFGAARSLSRSCAHVASRFCSRSSQEAHSCARLRFPSSSGTRHAGESKASTREAITFLTQLARLRLGGRPRLLTEFAAVGLTGLAVNMGLFAALLAWNVHYMLAALLATQGSTIWLFALTDPLGVPGAQLHARVSEASRPLLRPEQRGVCGARIAARRSGQRTWARGASFTSTSGAPSSEATRNRASSTAASNGCCSQRRQLFPLCCSAGPRRPRPLRRGNTSGPSGGTYTVQVCLTSPADGAILVGNTTVNVTATVIGSGPSIRRIVLYLSGEYLLTDFGSPYTFVLPTTKFVDGAYNLEVEAPDAGTGSSRTRPCMP